MTLGPTFHSIQLRWPHLWLLVLVDGHQRAVCNQAVATPPVASALLIEGQKPGLPVMNLIKEILASQFPSPQLCRMESYWSNEGYPLPAPGCKQMKRRTGTLRFPGSPTHTPFKQDSSPPTQSQPFSRQEGCLFQLASWSWVWIGAGKAPPGEEGV